jgi:tricorn protease
MLLAATAATVAFGAAFAARPSADGAPTRLLRMPTISATQIAFAYANNIWIVDRGAAQRAE